MSWTGHDGLSYVVFNIVDLQFVGLAEGTNRSEHCIIYRQR